MSFTNDWTILLYIEMTQLQRDWIIESSMVQLVGKSHFLGSRESYIKLFFVLVGICTMCEVDDAPLDHACMSICVYSMVPGIVLYSSVQRRMNTGVVKLMQNIAPGPF
jgi:hypothetical protein